MSQLILEFPLANGAIRVDGEELTLEFGNGVRLIAEVPGWVGEVRYGTLKLVMEVTGSPPDAKS